MTCPCGKPAKNMYCSRSCCGKAQGRKQSAILARNAGNRVWAQQAREQHHARLVAILSDVKAGRTSVPLALEQLVLAQTRAYQRGWMVGRYGKAKVA